MGSHIKQPQGFYHEGLGPAVRGNQADGFSLHSLWYIKIEILHINMHIRF